MGDYPYPLSVDGNWGSSSSKSITNKLQIYFQSQKKSGGGDCIVNHDDSSSRASVHFRTADVRGRVLEKKNHELVIDGKKVTLSVSTDGPTKGKGQTAKRESGGGEEQDQPAQPSDEKPGGGTPQSASTTTQNQHVSKGEEAEESSGTTGAEETTQTNTILLENVSENSTTEILGLMVESVCHVSAEDFSLEMISDISTAVITFNSTDDAARFLRECGNNRRFVQYGLRARAMEQSRSMRVENLPPHTTKDLLELYFEREKNGGGAVDAITMVPEEQAAIISFKDPKVVESVRNKPQCISGVPVKVYPYCDSLGTALYGKDRPSWKTPDPFTENVHPALLKFILTRKQIEHINDQMKMKFCEVKPEGSSLKLSPLPALLKQRGLTAKHIDDWRKNAADTFQSIMSKYKSFERGVNPSVWKLAEKEIHHAVKEDVLLDSDTAKGTLALAGLARDVDEMSEVVEEILQEITSQIDREKNGISLEVTVSPAMLHILQQDGLQKKATEKFPKLKISYRSTDSKLILTGLQNEVLMIQNMVLESKMQMKEMQVELEPNLLSFLKEVDNELISRDVFTSHGINALFKVERGGVVMIGSSDKALDDAEKQLKSVITFQNIDVKDHKVLKKAEWTKLYTQLKEAYSSPKKHVVSLLVTEDQITVSGFCEPVKEVSERLSDFINTHMFIEVDVPVKSSAVLIFMKEIKEQTWRNCTSAQKLNIVFDERAPAIKLSGEQVYVQEVKTLFQKIAASLHVDTLKIDKPGTRKFFVDKGKIITMLMRDHNCVVVLQEDNTVQSRLQEEMDQDSVMLFDKPAERTSQYNEPLMDSRLLNQEANASEPEEMFEMVKSKDGLFALRTKEGLTVTLREGNIQEATTEVIVNTISNNLDLSMGAVSKAILSAAGQELQAAIKKACSTAQADYGDLLITEGCDLKCKRVFHVVCPGWDKGAGKAEQTLKNIIKDCLEAAEGKELRSLSFPAIGTGNLRFPKPLVAEIMLDEVSKFSCKSNTNALREVLFIVHPSDRETVECFTKAFQEHSEKKTRQHSRGQSQKDSDVDQVSMLNPTTRATTNTATSPADTLSTHSVQIGNLTLELSSGDITKQATDVIINSSNRNFDLKSGVSKAILEGAGPAVEAECKEKAKQSNPMITTKAGNLPCQSIIHIDTSNQETKEIMYGVLQECEQNKFSSVALPALGTGLRGGSPSDAADEMIKAVLRFERKRSSQCVKCVKIVIFQKEMFTVFQKRVEQAEKEALNMEKSFLSKMKDGFNNLIWGSKENEKKVDFHKQAKFKFTEVQFPPAVIQFCAESPQDVATAKTQMQMLVTQEHKEKTIKDQCIAKFSQEDLKKLDDLQKTLSIHIRLETGGPEPCIKLEGLNYDVITADCEIRDIIRELEKAENLEREITLLSSLVEWQYEDRAGGFVPFDKQANHTLEKALENEKTQVTVKITDIDRQADLISGKVQIGKRDADIRRIVLKGESLPDDWDDMSGSAVKLVELRPDSKEFKDVENDFRETCRDLKIKKIERVQNATLWKSYQIRKKNLDDKNGHSNNERQLFHGTNVDTIPKINTNGFNRSYAGKNAAAYGNGTYFAVDARYSAANAYSVPDNTGQKYMYLTKVLVGYYTQGNQGLPAPPPKNTTDPTDLYDSVVDNVQNPKIFVIFNDVQAYPAYLISFK
ncbi:protein mono-ADP-ribosyltransferase PARP14-like [Megalops cyprinoides]|uniref:protein mono-ADP-ribosyltransferase PARP14-like n=1 Tax=Megalops cyprinoides TaxID=118141 RepID=UPI001864F441|nr:protein mono-ADP-ribosyltransferase PARP14-like [Megalops cyprinoides]